ncbi:MAG: hypothetical protein CM1200mP10_18110 [Candidatus Neomarinimicrobiota bacterium]|nr:MAG: hypothetical protein CM1200mP10_18110 [Candidatus Neomarinimicrobiota bacterium]
MPPQSALGARVKAFDTRPIVKEQVESLGAEFVSLETSQEAETAGGYAEEMTEDFYRHEHATIGEHLLDTDAVITTAQIFGKKSAATHYRRNGTNHEPWIGDC